MILHPAVTIFPALAKREIVTNKKTVVRAYMDKQLLVAESLLDWMNPNIELSEAVL